VTESPQKDRAAITFLMGCTGSGKGAVGRLLAQRIGAEIISVDSMKIYRRMDVGTAKPTAAQRALVPHHLLDVVEPSEEYSVAQFVAAADETIGAIRSRGRHVLCVGGTSLYIKAVSEGLFEGPSADLEVRARLKARAETEGGEVLHAEMRRIDPQAAERIHPNDLRRIVRALEVYELTGQPITALQTQWDQQRTVYDCTFVALRHSREEQSRRTNLRVARMIDAGLVAEVQGLLAEERPLSETARRAVGYAEIIAHLEGRISLDRAIEDIRINTRHFAKAQRTWFRRFPATQWIDVVPGDTAESVAARIEALENAPWSRP
jgi:tRNA dimethylallyltransferase